MKRIMAAACLFVAVCGNAQNNGFCQNVEFSPDGKRICTEVITKNGDNISFKSYIIRLSDNVVEKTIPGTIFPAWRPGGKYIAYSKKTGLKNGSDIWMMDIATGDTTRLTNSPSANTGVSFSPDGKRLCFSSDRDGRYNIYVMNVDGSGLEKITTDTSLYFNPVWSPAGNTLVYYRERGDRHDKVLTTNIDTKEETLVTNDTLHNIYPAWGPGGKAVIYTACTVISGPEPDKQIILLQNGNKGKVFTNAAGAFFARASADGKKLAYIKGRWPKTDIYISAIDGTNEQCITCNIKTAE